MTKEQVDPGALDDSMSIMISYRGTDCAGEFIMKVKQQEVQIMLPHSHWKHIQS